MSNLNSVFDTRRGYPFGSALEAGFEPASGVTLTEGKIVTVQAGRQLANASVLRMVTDATGGGSPPTLTAADKGKAYVVNTWGGSFTNGDIVEWDGDSFVVIVANVTGAPPVGTRVVVIETGAAGSFAGQAEKVMAYVETDPGPPAVYGWAVANTPTSGNRIRIKGGVYDELYFDYLSSNWVKAAKQVPASPFVNALTSGTQASSQKDDAWVVIQGNDQWDANFVNQVTCLKLRSGCEFKIAHTSANTLVAGTVVQANAGVLEAFTSKWPVGVVVWSNGTSGSGGEIKVASY